MAQQARMVAVGAALAYFAKQNIKVQTATPFTVRDKETGKESQKFDVKNVDLAAEHVLAARDYGNKVAIVTLDGRRHEAPKSPKDELPGVDDEPAAESKGKK